MIGLVGMKSIEKLRDFFFLKIEQQGRMCSEEQIRWVSDDK